MKKKMDIMIIGDGSVGKTSILKMFDKRQFSKSHIKTIGLDFIKTTYEADGHKLDVKLWDTAG